MYQLRDSSKLNMKAENEGESKLIYFWKALFPVLDFC